MRGHAQAFGGAGISPGRGRIGFPIQNWQICRQDTGWNHLSTVERKYGGQLLQDVQESWTVGNHAKKPIFSWIICGHTQSE